MRLVKTSIFSAIITFIRISSGFVAGKAIAIFTGPAGVALIGAFSNFITIVLTFANGAINNGVVKYTAEYHDNEFRLKNLFSTALKISSYCSIIVGLIIVGLAPFITKWLFSDIIYVNPIRILGLSISLYALNSLLTSILNGKGEIDVFTKVNAAGNIISLLLTILFVYYFNIEGALYALAIGQSIVCFVTIFLISKSNWFSWSFFTQPFNKILAIKLSHYSLMTIVSALTVPVAQILLRNMLTEKLGVDSAGYWQGMMRVSDGYLMLITTSLGTYYLPMLSKLNTDNALRKEIFRGYKIILPVVLVGCVLIYFLRFFIINLLYTPKFIIMESLFLWQLIGDFFKMLAWLLAYLILAKAMTKAYIITEVFFNICYVILGFVLVNYFGIKGITLAFAISYFLYMIVLGFFFRKLIFNYK